MAIYTQTRKISYLGDGVRVSFPFDFKMLNPNEVAVAIGNTNGTESHLQYATDYQVALKEESDDNPGGTVTFTSAPQAGAKIVIYSATRYMQPAVFTNQGGFYPRVNNDALDRLTILILQLLEYAGRTVVFPITADDISGLLPPPQSDMYIAWNKEATKLINKKGIQSDREPWFVAESANLDIDNGSKQKLTLKGDAEITFRLHDGDDLTLLLNPQKYRALLRNIKWFDRELEFYPNEWHSIVISRDKDQLYGWWLSEA